MRFTKIIVAVIVVVAVVGFVAWDTNLIPKDSFRTSNNENTPITTDDTKSPSSNQSIESRQMSFEQAKKVSITAPSGNDILEPGKPAVVVFSPVQGAVSYEITITIPAYTDRSRNLVSADKVDTLFKEVTSETTHTIIVPKTIAYQTSENGYNGEKIIVRALDRDGKQLMINGIQQGKAYEIPAVDEKQIKILSLPTQQNLLDADTYVLGKEGGTITLKFGALQLPSVKRKVVFVCPSEVNSIISIDGISCGGPQATPLEFGAEAFTKKMIVKGNPFPGRDTAIALMVSYYDSKGNRISSRGIDDQSWLSVKISK